jgi:hypothetical protein
MDVSPALLDEVKSNPRLSLTAEATSMSFDAAGNLTAF